jgi:GWxTD domain-containing protein
MRSNPRKTNPALALLVLAAASLAAEPPSAWLDSVAPVISPAERKAYLALNAAERPKYEETFWSDKAITAKEYQERVAYIDAKFGSGRTGSGANTDQGRVYLALGPPNKITRIPSSRIFQPVEIWYYSTVPGVVNAEVALMFYQKNGVGFPKLYSPARDTVRALLIPQSSAVHMFGPNDDLNEAEIRNTLQVSPAEDEIVSASVNVASGFRYQGNDEILGKVSSPAAMLGKPMVPEITSRLITSHPKLDILRTVSAFGGSQVDLRLRAPVRREIDLEVLEGDTAVYRNRLNFKFSDPETVLYTHRLDLLPGSYRIVITMDEKPSIYSLEVPREEQIGAIERADFPGDVSGRNTPFEFDGRQMELNPNGAFAVLSLPHPGRVEWMIRQGGGIVWRSFSEGSQIASVLLPSSGIEPGTYRIEALMGDDSASAVLLLGKEQPKPADATLVSFNANLAPARRLAFLGHQWLLRSRLDEARRSLQASLAKGETDEARIELARAEALTGNLDAARDRVKSVLAAQPANFDALSVYAYIETRFQDYAVAAELYRRALAIEDSPAVRAALAKLPVEDARQDDAQQNAQRQERAQ